MPTMLRLEMISAAILLILLILNIVRLKKLSLKYSFVWLIVSALISLFALFPNIMQLISRYLGFTLLSNMIFIVLIGALFFICLSLTIIVSNQSEKIKLLIQEVSLLKQKNDKK